MIKELKGEEKKWTPDSRFPWKESKIILNEKSLVRCWMRFDPNKGTHEEPGVAEFVFLIPKKWFTKNRLQHMLQPPFAILREVEDRPDDLMYRTNFYSPVLLMDPRSIELPTEKAVLGYFSKFVADHADALPE